MASTDAEGVLDRREHNGTLTAMVGDFAYPLGENPYRHQQAAT